MRRDHAILDRELQGAPVSRDRRIEIAGQLVEAGEVPRSQRFDGRLADEYGHVACLLRQVAGFLVVAQLGLVQSQVPLNPCDSRAEPQRQCTLQRSAGRAPGIREAAVVVVPVGQLAQVDDIFLTLADVAVQLFQTLARSDRVGTELCEECRHTRQRLERQHFERRVTCGPLSARSLAEDRDRLSEPVHRLEMHERISPLEHSVPSLPQTIVRRGRSKGNDAKRVPSWFGACRHGARFFQFTLSREVLLDVHIQPI